MGARAPMLNGWGWSENRRHCRGFHEHGRL